MILCGSYSQAQSPIKRDSLRRAVTQLSPAVTKKDMIVIKASEMPIPLKTTLEAIEYQGCEKGTIYRTKLNDMFLIEIKDGDRVRSYRFDANGKPLDP